jgi:hypothetical protein
METIIDTMHKIKISNKNNVKNNKNNKKVINKKFSNKEEIIGEQNNKEEIMDDQYNEGVIKEMYKLHYDYCKNIRDISNKYSIKVRNPIIPEHISENIVKMVLRKFLDMKTCTWNCKGDLSYNGNKIECKTFTSNGPMSFGPNEKWEEIYFYDARNWFENKHIIYKLPIKNTDPIFQEIKVNKTETFSEQAKQGRRPRINFDEFEKLVTNKLEKIFEGKFEEIF